MTWLCSPYRYSILSRVLFGCAFFLPVLLNLQSASAQDDPDTPGDIPLETQLEGMEINTDQLPRCFGMIDIIDPKALAICDALRLNQNVRARELSENWVRSEPANPAAQFSLAEVLYTVEANMPRALFHLTKAEELTNYSSLGRALDSGNFQWHYLTLSQLSFIYQLMGDQVNALAYLDKIESIYAQDVESFRGWPLIKLKEFDAARASANLVLENSVSDRERARAWNTLCAVELANLQATESLNACDRAISEDENIASSENDSDTVYLTNASEVALSLLQIDKAEEYLDRATGFLNPESVADPWVYKLFLTMNQGRFAEARQALDRMLLWRENQIPAVTIMNRAEHLMVSAIFLLLAGYPEDAAKLTMSAMNEPDRNGSFSADDAQKDSMAALINKLANDAWYQIGLEEMATMDFFATVSARISNSKQRVAAWRAGRKAASLFADQDILFNRLRPYAPLDVHIPEWIEPEIVALMGTGVMTRVLEEAKDGGAFNLNDGYYYAYGTEIAFLDKRYSDVVELGQRALNRLPQQEVLLQARLRTRMADAQKNLKQYEEALLNFQAALQQDPGVTRRLDTAIPIFINTDGSEFAEQVVKYFKRSPRFELQNYGLNLTVKGSDEMSVCLIATTGDSLSCFEIFPDESLSSKSKAQQLAQGFHAKTFSLGYEISEAQISLLMGTSVIMSSQRNSQLQNNRDALLQRQ